MDTDLPRDIIDLLRRGMGIFDMRAAVAAGVSAKRVLRFERAGVLTRLACSCFASTAALEAMDPWSLHAELARHSRSHIRTAI